MRGRELSRNCSAVTEMDVHKATYFQGYSAHYCIQLQHRVTGLIKHSMERENPENSYNFTPTSTHTTVTVMLLLTTHRQPLEIDQFQYFVNKYFKKKLYVIFCNKILLNGHLTQIIELKTNKTFTAKGSIMTETQSINFSTYKQRQKYSTCLLRPKKE